MQLKIRSHELKDYARVNGYFQGIEDTCEIEIVPIMLEGRAKFANATGLKKKALEIVVLFLHHLVPDGVTHSSEHARTLELPNETPLNDAIHSLQDFQPLAEELTERERDVLYLLAQGLTNNQIAETLTVAKGTIKAHNNHIFGKLGVTNRTQAVARARALKLL